MSEARRGDLSETLALHAEDDDVEATEPEAPWF
jgi:hypothetical protein